MKEKNPKKLEVINEIVRPIKEFGEGFLSVTVWGQIAPYMISTIKRVSHNLPSAPINKNVWDGETLGCFGMIAGLCAQAYTYGELMRDNPEILLLPFTTNVASGLYEVGRSVYKDAEERLIEQKRRRL